MKTGEDIFKTKDFYLTCFLKVKGLKLIGVDKIEYSKDFYFKFERIPNLDDLITGFYADREVVSANRFVNSIRDVRSLIHNIK